MATTKKRTTGPVTVVSRRTPNSLYRSSRAAKRIAERPRPRVTERENSQAVDRRVSNGASMAAQSRGRRDEARRTFDAPYIKSRDRFRSWIRTRGNNFCQWRVSSNAFPPRCLPAPRCRLAPKDVGGGDLGAVGDEDVTTVEAGLGAPSALSGKPRRTQRSASLPEPRKRESMTSSMLRGSTSIAGVSADRSPARFSVFHSDHDFRSWPR